MSGDNPFGETSPLLEGGQIVANAEVPNHTVDKSEDQEEGRVNRVFLAVAMIGSYLAMADGSFVTATNEEIGKVFQRSDLGPWLLSSYNFGYSIALPVYAHLCAAYGHKPVLVIAFVIFAFGTLVTGMSLSMPMLMIARFFTGIGGSGLVDVISILLNDLVSPSKVAVLRSYLSVASMLGISSGGPIGGLLTQTVGWRWSFIGQFPLIVVCLVVALRHFPGASTNVPRQYSGIISYLKPLRGLDFIGLSFLGISIGTLMVLLQTVQQYGPTAHPRTITFGITFATSATLFVVNELYLSKTPIIPTSTLKENGSWAICLGQILLFFVLSSLTSNLSMFYVRLRGANVGLSGLVLSPFPLGIALGSIIYGRLIRRTMRYKKLSIIGLGTIIASFAVLALIWRSSASYLSLIPVFLIGTGMAGLFTTQFIALSARSQGGNARTTITAYYLAQQLGSIIGVTTSATIVRTLFANDLRRSLHGVFQIDEVRIIGTSEAMVFSVLTLCYSLFKESSTTIASRSYYLKRFNRMFDKASNTASKL
ncbi:Major facilitator superfamily domain, general substrate transporter [Penicillium expansum]|uniref:Major facilitator superfamily domain, general substrate transporter n=1 Tax=Penicillium expansum TaxID=27334 RepID=A0A0A2JYW6_PENEN|nr:Major facilitator superfamily domain, general substrate transporter [Penicillium expansum]KGO47225.1 Major facilitator superfamily domain, general substrate transporter [Penicillium expansum]KGO54455.1 Major facilitator superfamily domain, general substrate transporter [Penicillium expansum]KGO60016.1 Major facilitator superfamily domain, general substrate transporter [Penicillium expansum]